MPRSSASIAAEEIDRFSRHAADWWNPDGAFRPLHRLNPVRVEYVRDAACAHFRRSPQSRQSLKGLTILDVGCGGGLLSEPMARLGGKVTGIDASEETVAAARQHARAVGLAIDYQVASVEELAAKKTRYDFITALEVVEHVADMDSFFEALAGLLKPGGLLVMSTLNRTPKSFLLGIVAAEYIFGWVPRGTHEWNKFVRPSELVKHLETAGLTATDLTGLIFNPLRNEFVLSNNDLDVNYLATAIRKK
ncbi:MAG: bifunctional 2-polyprenyl-6-hydroxyphenol methylase/3-demethylubiquinol 3-O-methyltransferase UbiG [Bdellovibrionales bacterium]